MSSKVTGLRLAPHVLEELEELCRLRGQTKAEVVTDLIMSVNKSNDVNTFQAVRGKDVNKSVCVSVGDKLPREWDLKAYNAEVSGLVEKILGKPWYVFPEDRVVAVRGKSANGSKQWLEVAKVYPDAVWEEADIKAERSRSSLPVTKLEECLNRYQQHIARGNHPTIIEARQKGWNQDQEKYACDVFRPDVEDIVEAADRYITLVSNPAVIQARDKGWGGLTPNKCLRCTLDELTTDAEKYLTKLEATPAIAEVHSAGSEMAPDLSEDTTTPEQTEIAPEHHLRLTIEELAKRLTPNGRDKARKHTAHELTKRRMCKLADWTAEIDPDQFSWLPLDESREIWVAKSPESCASASNAVLVNS